MGNESKITSFTDLNAWKKAHNLVLAIYKHSDSFPENEKFGLKSQIRRSAVSVTSNIAEGFGRTSKQDRARFYDISIGSTYELQNQLLIARDLGYLSDQDFKKLANQSIEVIKLIYSIKKGLSRL